MTVNTLVTGLIVFKILKVSLQVKGSLVGSTGGTKFQHILFVIIESGMTLFAIQLILLVLYVVQSVDQKYLNFVISTNEMFNVIIRSVHFSNFFLFFY